MRNTILIVDDSDFNVAVLEEILGEEYSLQSCGSGEAALELMARDVPDMVLLDIVMPGIDGYETCRRIRARASLRRTMVILLSAQTATAERLAGYDAGADDFVSKPFDQEELLAKIRVFMRLKVAEEIGEIQTDLISAMQREIHDPLARSMAKTSEQAAREGQRLNELALRGLTFCRLRSGDAHLSLSELDLAETMMKAAGAISNLFVVCDTPRNGLRALVDTNLMTLAIESLVGGVVRVSKRARRASIEIGMRVEAAKIVIELRLVGAPFEGGNLAELFESASPRNASPTLDLPLAREVFRAHGGDVVGTRDQGELLVAATAPLRIATPTV